jgi:endo-1,4-beta-xylanase
MGGTSGACTAGTPLTGGTQYCSSGLGNVGNGYAYEVWLSPTSTGTNCATVYGVDAAFKANWNLGSGGDFLARVGLSFNRTKTYDQIGTISADYAFTKTGTGQSFIGIYGWSFTPLIEYYIVEDWITGRPAYPNSKLGPITVDGGMYDVYTNTQVNQSSPLGITTFQQFWSVRQTGRQCGHVSISEHFSQWASLGMQLGLLGESKLLVEALNGSGTVDFTRGTVVVNPTTK